jgi:ABC-type proline/glycine betaine transport system substrate-binding protein
MEQMIDGLMSKVGLSREKAEQVVQFMKDNASRLPEWLSKSETARNLASKLPGFDS